MNQKTVQQAVLRTGAQLANLCTFLPQEKVNRGLACVARLSLPSQILYTMHKCLDLMDPLSSSSYSFFVFFFFFFLKQVGEFSGFDASQLLRETEKAVGGPDLLAEHDRLAAIEVDLGDVERQLGAKRDKLEQLKEQNKALERDKEKMEQRKEHLEKADLCEKR